MDIFGRINRKLMVCTLTFKYKLVLSMSNKRYKGCYSSIKAMQTEKKDGFTETEKIRYIVKVLREKVHFFAKDLYNY